MSLDAMKDIHLPDPPSFWPLPWTVWAVVIALLLAIGLARMAWRVIQQRRQHQGDKISHTFRQEALQELQKIRWDQDNPASSLQAINIVLKRVAITRYKRGEVSALTGDEWLRYLDESAGVQGTVFLRAPINALGHDCFNPHLKMDKSTFKKILVTAKQWIDKQ